MELTNSQIKQLKEKELDILKIVIQICSQLNICYFVVQGTLLGAVRHQGFIPWDDDIDIGMLRKDYDIFIKKGQDLLPPPFFIQTHATDPMYPNAFAKVRNSDTAFVETTCKNLDMNHGIYIDVFPFDFYPDNPVKSGIFQLKKLLLRYRVRCELYISADSTRSFKNLVRHLLKCTSRIVYPSLQVALKKQECLYCSTIHGKQIANHGSPWGKRECFPAEWLSDFTTLKFEGISVSAPAHYRDYLAHVYGDYMKLPPPEQRIPHHYVSLIDFGKSYSPKLEGQKTDDGWK